jgi:hypothetical protein
MRASFFWILRKPGGGVYGGIAECGVRESPKDERASNLEPGGTKSAIMTPVSSLVLSNPFGRIQAGQPFAPFGMQPALGAFFLIESPAFQQPQGELVLNIAWNSLPASFDFAKYYGAYGVPIDASSFQVGASYRDKGPWRPLALRDPSLFRKTANGWTSQFAWRAPATDTFKLELTAPAFGFGASLYAQVLAEAALKGTAIPNPPLTPVTSAISVFYR